jgi:hypothetical protein
MGKELRIWLPDEWANTSDQNPDGPLTLCWDNPEASGAFQVSTAEYKRGEQPRPSKADLIKFAVEFGRSHQFGQLISSRSGACMMGAFGTAIFQRTNAMAPEAPAYFQVWFISNGLDFVFATFVAMTKPQDRELADAQLIAEAIDVR